MPDPAVNYPDTNVNYWDLIAENSRLTERLLACLEAPTYPGPQLIGGYVNFMNFPGRTNPAGSVLVEISTSPDGKAMRYIVKDHQGTPIHRGMWNICMDDK